MKCAIERPVMLIKTEAVETVRDADSTWFRDLTVERAAIGGNKISINIKKVVLFSF